MEVKRGDVWWADLSPTRGTEQYGRRPILVVQSDRANPYSPHTIIVPFTTKIRSTLLPSHVLVSAEEGGLKENSVLLCEQIRVIDKSRLIEKIGTLSEAKLEEVARSLHIILDLH